MAEDSGQDKTEDASGKRLEDSRKKGQIARSKELNNFVTLIVSSSLILLIGKEIAENLQEMMSQQFSLSREAIFDPATPIIYFKQAFLVGFKAILPLMAVLLIADLLVPLLMGGWNFSAEAYQIKFSKLNPLAGLKRILGITGLMKELE